MRDIDATEGGEWRKVIVYRMPNPTGGILDLSSVAVGRSALGLRQGEPKVAGCRWQGRGRSGASNSRRASGTSAARGRRVER